MKKILILANSSGGLYNFRLELIQKLLNEKYIVYFAVPQTIDDEKVALIINEGANYVHVPMNRRGMNVFEEIKLIDNYKTIINKIKPDIILTYTIKPNIYGNYVANKHVIPVIMNITGLGSSLTTGKFKLLIKKLYKYACRKANCVFFQNKGNYYFFIEKKLVNKGKANIIPGSGVNIDKFTPIEKSNNDYVTRFLFIGRLMRDKGIEEYLRAANNITEGYKDVEFQILGSLEEEKYKKYLENNLNSQIRYLGISDDVRKEISEVDCVVNPSYHEGMSNVLLEGAAMGKPLIASNIPGCKEIIEHEKNGFLFQAKSSKDLEYKLLQFIKLKKEERLTMGEYSRKKVENEFDRKIVVNEYIRAIESILR